MNTDSYRDFIDECKKQIDVKKPVNLSVEKKDMIDDEVFQNVEKVKRLASKIRYKFINSIDDNLRKFDKIFSENGANIHWCIAYDDFLDKLDKLLQVNKVNNVNVFSDAFSKELGIEDFLQKNEYKSDVDTYECTIFTPQFGIVNTGSLLLNFKSAYDMELVLSSKLKIFILPINDFLFKLEDIEIFLHLYSIYHDGVDFPYLTSVYTPEPTDKKSDVHLFLIDNGRTNILANKDIRTSLSCISCNVCKEVCPVHNRIGDKPYNNVFTGPIANVVLPFIENIENYKHLCFSCTLCGNCSTVCPVKIPISSQIISNKHYFFYNKMMDLKDTRLSKQLGRTLHNRKSLNSKRFVKNIKIKLLANNNIAEQYNFSKSTFNQQYILKKNANKQ